MTHAIWAEGLGMRFGETTALDGAALAVRSGAAGSIEARHVVAPLGRLQGMARHAMRHYPELSSAEMRPQTTEVADAP